MEAEFISVNNCIIDYNEYVKIVILLKNFLKNKFKELLYKEDFVLTEHNTDKHNKTELTFYNKEYDLEINISIKKRNKEVFV